MTAFTAVVYVVRVHTALTQMVQLLHMNVRRKSQFHHLELLQHCVLWEFDTNTDKGLVPYWERGPLLIVVVVLYWGPGPLLIVVVVLYWGRASMVVILLASTIVTAQLCYWIDLQYKD